jgi:hypothetical protein
MPWFAFYERNSPCFYMNLRDVDEAKAMSLRIFGNDTSALPAEPYNPEDKDGMSSLLGYMKGLRMCIVRNDAAIEQRRRMLSSLDEMIATRKSEGKKTDWDESNHSRDTGFLKRLVADTDRRRTILASAVMAVYEMINTQNKDNLNA